MLTAQQRKCYDFLRGYVAESGGVSPTFREIQEALALKSKSQVNRLLNNMEARGRISRIKRHHRAITVIPEQSTRSQQVIQLVSYPDAQCFVWDDEAKVLKPMGVKA